MRRALTLALALFAACPPPMAPAWADGSAPSASGCDAGAEVVLVQKPDGGAPLPAAICRGQSAPADGVFLRTDSASELAGRCAADKAKADQLEAAIKQAPPASASVVLAVGGGAMVVGLVVGFFLAKR